VSFLVKSNHYNEAFLPSPCCLGCGSLSDGLQFANED
jgi:hypothetical protein